MKAMLYNQPGGTDVLEYVEIPDPEPGAADVIIDVGATSLNRLDVVQRNGMACISKQPTGEPVA